jgi:hypothetical protein
MPEAIGLPPQSAVAVPGNESNHPVPDKNRLWKRVAFTLGLMNIGLTGYIIGAFPTKYYLWYACLRMHSLRAKVSRMLNE